MIYGQFVLHPDWTDQNYPPKTGPLLTAAGTAIPPAVQSNRSPNPHHKSTPQAIVPPIRDGFIFVFGFRSRLFQGVWHERRRTDWWFVAASSSSRCATPRMAPKGYENVTANYARQTGFAVARLAVWSDCNLYALIAHAYKAAQNYLNININNWYCGWDVMAYGYHNGWMALSRARASRIACCSSILWID